MLPASRAIVKVRFVSIRKLLGPTNIVSVSMIATFLAPGTCLPSLTDVLTFLIALGPPPV